MRTGSAWWCGFVSVLVAGCGGGDRNDRRPDGGGADAVAPSDTGAADAPINCTAAPTPDFRAPLDFTDRTVDPASVDARTNLAADINHKVLVPRGTPTRRELFVMLSGSGGRPSNNMNLLRIAVRAGYRAIGLVYPNDESGADLCAGQPPECQGLVHLEMITGQDVASSLRVDVPNSIEYRLSSLLQDQNRRFPTEGWGAYLDGTRIRWDQVVLAGFSQGSGHAGYIAKDHLLARVVFFSSGGDSVAGPDGSPQPAPWCLLPRMTPPERTYGLLHLQDNFEVKRVVYRAYGLDRLGDFSRADQNAPPHGCTHQLNTDAPWNPGSSPHLSLASDNAMPLDRNGVPLLAEDYFDLFTR